MFIASTLSHIPKAPVELVELLDLGLPSHLMASNFKDSVNPYTCSIDGLKSLMGIELYIFDAFLYKPLTLRLAHVYDLRTWHRTPAKYLWP